MEGKPWLIIAAMLALQTCLLQANSYVPDRIKSFPGQPHVGFGQFSGYIAVGENPPRSLFYYFVEAESSPASKPLVLWLNGGPGCSSFGYGGFVEHGPFKVKKGALVRNNHSWNKEANMLYLESPAGVGFSYSTNQSFYISLSDNIAARDTLKFLQLWFTEYPHYKNRDFFVTGESYAGHYVPQLASLILRSKAGFKLKGIAIGNPSLKDDADMNSWAPYLWSHGIISDQAAELLTDVCNVSRLTTEVRSQNLTSDCAYAAVVATTEISSTSIDQYDILADICLTPGQTTSSWLYNVLLSKYRFPKSVPFQEDLKDLNYERLLETRDPCEEKEVVKYLNRKDVQAAIHAKLVGSTNWTTCNTVITEMYKDADRSSNIIPILKELVKAKVRVLVYSGDLDSVVPFLGTRALVDMLARNLLNLKPKVPYRAWFSGKQVAGYTQHYSELLTYATIRGASHAAPATQPERSLTLFSSFLHGKQLPKE